MNPLIVKQQLETVNVEDVEGFVKTLEHIAVVVGQGYATLTKKERQALPKARRNITQTAKDAVDLARKHEVDASATDALDAGMQLVARIKPLVDQAHTLTQLLDDIVLQTESDASMALNSVVQQMRARSKTNGALAAGLAPIREAMSHRRAKKADAATAPPPAQPQDAARANPATVLVVPSKEQANA